MFVVVQMATGDILFSGVSANGQALQVSRWNCVDIEKAAFGVLADRHEIGW